jgi:cytochrome P450
MHVADGWDPDAFDPHDPGFLSDPYPTYARFRDEAPVHVVQPYGTRWVFRYADVQRVLTDTATFVKNAPGGSPPPPGPLEMMSFFPEGLFSSDPPRHTELRALLEPLFGTAIKGAPDLVETLAAPVVDRVRQGGRIELMADYALPVPSSVLFSILGIPDDPAVWQGLRAWVTAIVAAHDVTQSMPVHAAGATCAMALHTFMTGLVIDARRTPRAGLIGAMCDAIGDDLTAEDVQVCCADFLVAGYLSTTYLIGTGIRNLLADPHAAQAVRDDPSLLPAAVEEMLRFDAPAQLADRVAAVDTELGGTPLRAGDHVTAVLGSADHDPEAFASPEKFRIARKDEGQMSFGAGIHHCIGAPLVRLVAPVAIGALMALPGLTVDGLAQWQTDPYLRGPVSLPLRTA